ncbi:MAG: pilus assembly protein PilP [Pseudomonadales bacterium]
MNALTRFTFNQFCSLPAMLIKRLSSAVLRVLALASVALMLQACGSDETYSDLQQYMAESQEKAASRGSIDPIPAFRPYQAFQYSATAMRAPFDVPIDVKELVRIGGPSSDVKPDENRSKEYLERFNLEGLQMVGSLEQRGLLWILIDDQGGLVHRVTVGNYLGRNHGRIVEVSESQVSVVEIVSSGEDSWIERPRTLKLRETEDSDS